MVVRVHMTAGRGLIPEAQLCPQGLPFQPCLPLAPRRGSLPAAFAPPSASGGSGPAWPLSGSAGTTLLPATSAAPTPPPGRAETERRNGKGDRAGRRGREKRQVGGRGEEKEKGKNKVNTRSHMITPHGATENCSTNSPIHQRREKEGQVPETQERAQTSGRWREKCSWKRRQSWALGEERRPLVLVWTAPAPLLPPAALLRPGCPLLS